MSGNFRVGDWLVQRDLNRITSGDRNVQVEPKVIEVLVFLADHPGEVLSKEKIIGAIWAGTFVSDEVLTYSISELRKAFGDDARNPRIIQTIPRRGYRLIAPVSRIELSGAQAETMPADEGAAPDLPPEKRRKGSGRHLGLAALILFTLTASIIIYLRLRPAHSPIAGDGGVILAVLPFENLGTDQGQEYFSDGLTEEMINQLGRLQPARLRVIARTTAMQYKGSRKRVDQIGRELGANYILEGTVRREGTRVRVNAQLVQVSDQTQLWSEAYNRELSGILEVQNEVAQAVAGSIHVTLTDKEQARLAGKRPVVPEAHEAYLRGRFFWNKRTSEELRKSTEYFEEAILKDPSYARAYAGSADAWLMLNEYADTPPDEAYPRARSAAMKAIELDPELAEAHASLAMCLFCQDWDWSRAEREFQRAISLNPSYTTAHHWYANLLSAIGRTEDARAELQRAVQIDSLSAISHVALGWRVHASAKRYDQAAKETLLALELDPHYEMAHRRLGVVLVLQGKHKEGIDEIRRGVPSADPVSLPLADLGHAYGIAGMRDDSRRVLNELLQASSRSYVDAARIALIYIGLGEKNQALDWLEKAYQERAVGLLVIKADPRFEPLHDQPRYRAIIRAMRLPE